jgi:hypothetical protein
VKEYGLNLEKEAAELDGTEWKFGGFSQPCIASIPEEERENLLPIGEVQVAQTDLMDCASRAVANIAEAKLTYLYRKDKLTLDNRLFLEGNGYVIGDRVVLSDAFIAIKSGTTKQGNSLKAPLDAYRKLGTVPKTMLPLVPSMTFEQYHNPSRITKDMEKIAAEFAQRFTWNYEQVYAEHFADCLKDDFIDVALFAWSTPKDGIYPRTPNTPNHAVALFKPRYFAFDNYEEAPSDFIKHLATDFSFHHYGYRLYLSGQNTVAQSPISMALEALKKSLLALDAWLSDILPQQKPTPTPTPVEPKPVPSSVLLNALFLAMRRHEGWYIGSRSQRNNNPLNCRYSSVGYLPKYGEVKEDRQGAKAGQRGFAIFKDYETGALYCKNLILQKAKKHPDWSLFSFIGDEKEGWAPASDNNNVHAYVYAIAKEMNVNPTTFTLKQLL